MVDAQAVQIRVLSQLPWTCSGAHAAQQALPRRQPKGHPRAPRLRASKPKCIFVVPTVATGGALGSCVAHL